MAKGNSMTKTKAAATKAKARTDATIANRMTKAAIAAQNKVEQLKKNLSTQNSVTRTITVDGASAIMAHTADQLLQFSARALGEYSQRTAGAEGHFAKHVGIYASVPQTAIGFLVYILELATRNKGTDLKLSLGREIAHNTSNLLANLGLANSIRAVRYYLSQSIDENQEQEKEKLALLNKIAALTKQLEEKK